MTSRQRAYSSQRIGAAAPAGLLLLAAAFTIFAPPAHATDVTLAGQALNGSTTGWTNPTNVFADDATYATATQHNKAMRVQLADVPAGHEADSIRSVTVELDQLISASGTINDGWSLEAFLGTGATALATSPTLLGTSADATLTWDITAETTWTIADLDSLEIRIVTAKTGSADGTWQADQIRAVVDFNAAPTADAGADQDALEGSAVALDGSSSSDPDDDALTYAWTQTMGPAVSLDDATAASPTFTAPSVSADTQMRFSLVVDDGDLSSAADEVEVWVRDDATPPDLDVSSTCAEAGLAGWCRGNVTINATASDDGVGLAPGSPSCTLDDAPAACTDLVVSDDGTHQFVASATDLDGNGAESSLEVRVDATTPLAEWAVECDEPGLAGWCRSPGLDYQASSDDATSGLAAGSPVCTIDAVEGPCGGTTIGEGSHTFHIAASDAAGNAAESSAEGAVDSVAPELATPDDLTVEAAGPSGTNVDFELPLASDATSGAGTVACDPSPGSLFPLGDTPVTCSVDDAAGHHNETNFMVSVVDTTPPSIAAAPNLTAEAQGPTGAVVDFEAPATSDAVDGEGVATCQPASGSLFPLGATTVDCTASDDAGNEATHSTFEVSVVDTTPPDLSVPADMVAEATGPDGAEAAFDVTASDLVTSAPGITCSAESGDTFPLGNTTVECEATDEADNTAAATFHVEVIDTTPPSIAPAANLTREADNASGAAVTFDAPLASDLVDGSFASDCLPASGTLFPLGDTLVTCSAADAAGNPAPDVSFLVTIVDTTTPTLDLPDFATLETDGPAVEAAYEASATDTVDGPLPLACDPPVGAELQMGWYVVACTATDEAGNVAEGSFDLVVAPEGSLAVPAIEGEEAPLPDLGAESMFVGFDGPELVGVHITFGAPGITNGTFNGTILGGVPEGVPEPPAMEGTPLYLDLHIAGEPPSLPIASATIYFRLPRDAVDSECAETTCPPTMMHYNAAAEEWETLATEAFPDLDTETHLGFAATTDGFSPFAAGVPAGTQTTSGSRGWHNGWYVPTAAAGPAAPAADPPLSGPASDFAKVELPSHGVARPLPFTLHEDEKAVALPLPFLVGLGAVALAAAGAAFWLHRRTTLRP